MPKLIIDTTSRICQVALIQNYEIVAHSFEETAFGMGEILFGLIDKLFETSGTFKKDISEIYVTLGPGSFTGVRIGISAALGLKLGLNVPLYGISALKAHKMQAKKSLPTLVVLDARRKDFYVQAFDENDYPITDPLNISIETLKMTFSNSKYFVCGDCIDQIQDDQMRLWIWDQSRFLDPMSILKAPLEASPVPLYVRSPDVGI